MGVFSQDEKFPPIQPNGAVIVITDGVEPRSWMQALRKKSRLTA